jgi:FkbM family methyltransferase
MNLFEKAKNISDIDSLIHIGGHKGEEIEWYKSLNLKNVIYVEPIKKFAKEIENKIKDLDNFSVLAIGLGSEDKEDKINIAEDNHSGSSSIFSPRPSSIEFVNKEKIIVKKFSSLDLPVLDLAIIDTQGYELEVLKGFEEKINDFKFLIVEFSNYEGYIGQVTYNQLNKFLNSSNFFMISQIKNVKKVLKNKNGGSYGDALYVNSSYLSSTRIAVSRLHFLIVNNIISDLFVKFSKLTTYKMAFKKLIKK